VLGGNPNSTYGAPFSHICCERQLSENGSLRFETTKELGRYLANGCETAVPLTTILSTSDASLLLPRRLSTEKMTKKKKRRKQRTRARSYAQVIAQPPGKTIDADGDAQVLAQPPDEAIDADGGESKKDPGHIRHQTSPPDLVPFPKDEPLLTRKQVSRMTARNVDEMLSQVLACKSCT